MHICKELFFGTRFSKVRFSKVRFSKVASQHHRLPTRSEIRTRLPEGLQATPAWLMKERSVGRFGIISSALVPIRRGPNKMISRANRTKISSSFSPILVNDNDFYPTPADLVASLPIGLLRLGLRLPRVALDPCGGDGALCRGLTSFGVDVRLSDLYPDKYQDAPGCVASQPLDASDPDHLQYVLELAAPNCTAIITNTPHNTDEACAIVRNQGYPY
jgi:hypothetical protein